MNSVVVPTESGTAVAWRGREYRISDMWSATEALLLDPSTRRTYIAKVSELQPPNNDPAAVPVPTLAGVSEAEWTALMERGKAVHELVNLSEGRRSRAKQIAAQFGVSVSAVYRWAQRYQRTGVVMSLQNDRPGPKPGTRKLDRAVEDLIATLIKSTWLKSEAPTQAVFVQLVRRAARSRGLRPPSIKAVRARLSSLPERDAMRARRGRKAASQKYDARPGIHVVNAPLEEVQIDHTPVDIIVVTDDAFRDAIGRPYLTLAIDVNTRAIVGYYLSLDRPNAYTVGLCIALGCLPKDRLLADLGITGATWFMQGIPKKLFLDNAREHHAVALRRGCEANLIALEYRPVGRCYFGGHIERLIGTAMRWFHALPGSTRSNIVARGAYDAEATAVMTLPELDKYLVTQILAYNCAVHSALSISPNQAWELAWEKEGASPAPVVPPASLQFLSEFMPFVRRRMRRTGIESFANHYWNDALAALIGHPERLEVLYDPQDISSVFVRDPSGKLMSAAYCTPGFPRLSLREWNFRKARQREKGRRADEVALRDNLLNAADTLVADASKKQRKARRKRSEALRHTLENADRTRRLCDDGAAPPPPATPAAPDFDAEGVSAFPVETTEG